MKFKWNFMCAENGYLHSCYSNSDYFKSNNVDITNILLLAHFYIYFCENVTNFFVFIRYINDSWK